MVSSTRFREKNNVFDAIEFHIEGTSAGISPNSGSTSQPAYVEIAAWRRKAE